MQNPKIIEAVNSGKSEKKMRLLIGFTSIKRKIEYIKVLGEIIIYLS